MTMVLTLLSLSPTLNTTISVSPSSSTYTLSAIPSSSEVGGVILGRAVAPVARASLLTSHLLISLTAIMLYLLT